MSKVSSIEWATKTWNPINGRCPNSCDYCYMWGKGGIGNRFAKVHDHPLRLDEKVLAKVPKFGTAFVGSSTDMWVDQSNTNWIWKVLYKINTWVEDYKFDYDYDPYDWVRYIFLTKKPERYREFKSMLDKKHIWCGATWDGDTRTYNNIVEMRNLKGFNSFVSFEPLLSDPTGLCLDKIKWVIIGADSRRGQPKPPKEWADYLIGEVRRVGAKVFVKDNYGYPEKIKELPF